MIHDHEHIHHGCTHCGCNNPVLKILEKELSSSEIITQLSENKKPFVNPTEESVLFHGGIIRPLIDGKTDTVEAIGFHKGKVVASGSMLHVTEAMIKTGHLFKTKKLDKGHTLLPGLIEPHVHLVPSAILGSWLDLSPYNGQFLKEGYNTEWLKNQLNDYQNDPKNKEKLNKNNYWILGCNLDPAFMPFEKSDKPGTLNKLVTFDYQFLDDIVPDYPVFIMSASMHTAYVNSLTLRIIFDLNKSIRDQYKTFENYQQTTNGQLQETEEIGPALKCMPIRQVAEFALASFKNLDDLFDTAVKRGVTFMYDAGMTSVQELILKLYLDFHQKKVRIGVAQTCLTLDEAKKLPTFTPIKEYKDLYSGSVKIISDGSNQGLTGYQSKPYCCYPADNLGVFNFPEDKEHPHPDEPTQTYLDIVKTVVAEKEWPLMIHANGDLAVKFAIEVYDAAFKAKKVADRRHRIEHCSILEQSQIQQMKDLGIVPSFLIGHVGYYGYPFKEAIFEEKVEKLDLCRSSLDAGLRISLHTDYSVSPIGPLRMMEQAITRMMEAAPDDYPDKVLNEKECLTPEQALLSVTYDAAWQCHAEQWTGSLQDGYFADFVILEQDPLTMKTYYKELRKVPVLETWKGGVKVYTNTDIVVPEAV